MPTITMSDSPVSTIAQVRSFLQLDEGFKFEVSDKRSMYQWVESALIKFRYHSLKKKKERVLMRRYIRKVSGLSKAQLTRLIARHRTMGKIIPYCPACKRNGFRKKYFPCDIARLIETDCAHDHLSGEATKQILVREDNVFG